MGPEESKMRWREFCANLTHSKGMGSWGEFTVKLMFMTELGVVYSNCKTCNA